MCNRFNKINDVPQSKTKLKRKLQAAAVRVSLRRQVSTGSVYISSHNHVEQDKRKDLIKQLYVPSFSYEILIATITSGILRRETKKKRETYETNHYG